MLYFHFHFHVELLSCASTMVFKMFSVDSKQFLGLFLSLFTSLTLTSLHVPYFPQFAMFSVDTLGV